MPEAATPLDQQLIDAVFGKRKGDVRDLLAQGANPTTLDDAGLSATHYAAQQKDTGILETVLASPKAVVDTPDKNGRAPLGLAAGAGNIPAIKALLKKGAKPNLQSTGGYTALHQAVNNNHLAAARALAEGGADATIPNDHGVTPLDLAVRKDQTLSENFELTQFLKAVEVQKYLKQGTTRQVVAPHTATFSSKPKA